MNSPINETFTFLTDLAWKSRLALPILVTVGFMIMDVRLQIEINIHTGHMEAAGLDDDDDDDDEDDDDDDDDDLGEDDDENEDDDDIDEEFEDEEDEMQDYSSDIEDINYNQLYMEKNQSSTYVS